MEIRIAAIGNVDSAKSTTISCITNNILDDGRGLAREKICNHPHEIESGRTSSISHHFIKKNPHLITFIDLAGHEKYLKTTTSGLASCFIDYAMLTIGADRGIVGMAKEHLILAIILNIPIFIVITKIDISPLHKLDKIKNKLIRMMSSKGAGMKKCMIINDGDNISNILHFKNKNICPIFLTSNTNGTNLYNLKTFIFSLVPTQHWNNIQENKIFIIDSVFKINGVGIVLYGTVKQGPISINDHLFIGPFYGKFKKIFVKSIHNNFRQHIQYLDTGSSGSINIKLVHKKKDQIKREFIKRGMVCLQTPKCIKQFEAEITILHHPTTIKVNYQPTIHCGSIRQVARICKMNKELVRTGDKAIAQFEFMFHPEYMEVNSQLVFRDGRTKGVGRITSIKYTNE